MKEYIGAIKEREGHTHYSFWIIIIFALELLSTISFEGFESKTLDINSVVKDPTFLDLGLVPKVK
jgi:hypothetical protein